LLVVRENDGENLSEKKMTEERETKLHEAARKKGPIQFGRSCWFISSPFEQRDPKPFSSFF